MHFNLKVTLVSVVFLLSCYNPAFSQVSDPWIGTWTSESYWDTDWGKDNPHEVPKVKRRLVLRITKEDAQYVVRQKSFIIDNPDDYVYRPLMTVTKVDENVMYLQSTQRDDSDKKDIIDITSYYKLTKNSGIIHYSHYLSHIIRYDESMRIKEEVRLEGGNEGDELDMYNDDW